MGVANKLVGITKRVRKTAVSSGVKRAIYAAKAGKKVLGKGLGGVKSKASTIANKAAGKAIFGVIRAIKKRDSARSR